MKKRSTLRFLMNKIRELQEENETLRAQLESDPLTGLGNARALERLTEDRAGWYVMADLNGFKAAQDEHQEGHDFGDRILREFSRYLLQNTRRGDHVVVRRGGDEFVIFVPQKAAAKSIKHRIRVWRSGLSKKVTAAVGIGIDLTAADAAMYLDKTNLDSKDSCDILDLKTVVIS